MNQLMNQLFQSPASVNTQSTGTLIFEDKIVKITVSITCIGEHPVNRVFCCNLLHNKRFQSPASVNTQSTLLKKIKHLESMCVSITCIGEHPVNKEHSN